MSVPVLGAVHRSESLRLGLVLLGLATVLTSTDLLGRWDNLFYDAQLRLFQRPPPSAVIIVAIDEESLAALGRWPWPRRVHAQMVERLTQAGAKVIGMDILFVEPDRADAAGDELLARAIQAHGRVVLAVAPQTGAGHRLSAIRPLPMLVEAAQLGHVDFELDADGIVRSVYLRAGMGEPTWPALGLAMLDLGMPGRSADLPGVRREARGPDPAGKWVRDYRILLPFFGGPGSFEQVAFSQVLAGDPVLLERLRGRYVLIGATAAGVGESLATPVSGRNRPMSGVELNANVLAGLAQDVVVEPLSPSAQLGWALLFSLLPVLIYPHCRPRTALLAYGALLLLGLVASVAMLQLTHWWFAPAVTLVVLATSYPLWSWRRLDATVSELTSERNRVQATLHSIGDAVVTTDAVGQVEYLNPVAERLTGQALAAARGLPLHEVLRLFDESGQSPVTLPLQECLIEGKTLHPGRYDLLRTPLGDEHAIRWSASPIHDATGAIGGMVFAFSDMTQMLALSREMVRQATHDALTDLPNRVLLEDRLEKALARARRAAQHVAVLFIDLDGFKKVNDAFGHAAGDALLKDVAVRLNGSCREEDSVGRWGGDEFVVLLEKLDGRDGVTARAVKLLQLLALPFRVLGQEVYVTASIGISLFPRDADDVGGLFKRADAAMYRAKQDGSNNFKFYSRHMNDHAVERLALEKALWNALPDGELVLHYQPQVELASGRVSGVEALMRWQRPGEGMILPGRFLPVAEQSELVHALGDWVLQAACAHLVHLRRCGLPGLHVAINLAPRQLLKRDVYTRIATVMREAKIDPSRLVLEISENLYLQDPSDIGHALQGLREMGVRISIDDFGTGYSSIGYLKRLPIDQVKIDKSFVHDMAVNADDAAVVRGIVTLAHSLRLEVIAEGVETEAQLRLVRELGCDGAQGFYFSYPLAPDVLNPYLLEHAGADALTLHPGGTTH
jgi:diguanylate cyclase (GGDEF)-like protein/PAS domain S-box-containing protein